MKIDGITMKIIQDVGLFLTSVIPVAGNIGSEFICLLELSLEPDADGKKAKSFLVRGKALALFHQGRRQEPLLEKLDFEATATMSLSSNSGDKEKVWTTSLIELDFKKSSTAYISNRARIHRRNHAFFENRRQAKNYPDLGMSSAALC